MCWVVSIVWFESTRRRFGLFRAEFISWVEVSVQTDGSRCGKRSGAWDSIIGGGKDGMEELRQVDSSGLEMAEMVSVMRSQSHF